MSKPLIKTTKCVECAIKLGEIRDLRHALRNLVDQIEHGDGAIECGYAHEVLGDDDE